MTISADDTPGTPAVSLHVAEPDEYCESFVRCPLCGERVDGSPGTPSVPLTAIEDGISVDVCDGSVPAFGYRCSRHRQKIRLVALGHLAPSNYTVVGAEIDGESVEIAIPDSVVQGAEA